ncbi:trace amine-associated receptor 1-like [Dunckerocampus dactyliophorus]|uniref:trace amine-associated receptor 1-like n=1 Tax=Dunckerocampus dactyliophorus TaxID=161453 RepID=UPI002406B51B|nr:trace amine-associated receptor 1-like [Dunckerocampus dactyliophorus]
MEEDAIINGTDAVNAMHPCYERYNASLIFTSNPSITCVFVYCVLGLLSVATICGNLLVVISVVYFQKLHTPTNYFILSLSVADLLVGVLVFPFSMAFTVTSCLSHEDLIYRYYAVCQPLTYRSKISVQVALTMILVCWGVAAMIGLGIIIGGYSQGTCEEMCSVNVILSNIMGPVLAFYLPAVIMSCIYLKIFFVAQRQVSSLQSSKSVSKLERKATKTLAIVMGVFLLFMSPYFFCVVFQPLFAEPPSIPVIETLNWLTLSNSMLNPFIYAFFYNWFRSAFKMIITGKIFQGDFADCTLM